MAEIVIIGAGVVGCLTALRLADDGHACTIIDAGDTEHTASHASAGGIYLQLQPRFTDRAKIERHGAVIAPLLKATFPAWWRLLDRLPGLPLCASGGVIVGLDENDMSALQTKHEVERSLGLASTLLDANDVRHLSRHFSPDIAGGCYMINEGHCEPVPLMQRLRDELRRLNVRLRTRTAAKRLHSHADGVMIETDLSPIRGDIAVLASGGFTADLLESCGIVHGIRSLDIQMCATAPSMLDVPLLTRAMGRRLSLKKMGNDAIWIGGGWEAADYDAKTQSVQLSDRSERDNIATAADVVPGLRDIPIQRRWGGRVAWARDGLPVIGRLPNASNVVMACAGNGYSLAPLYSEVLADLATGKAPAIDLTNFRVERFAAPTIREGIEILPD